MIAKHRYGVYFYGTGETASVKSEDLEAYDEKNRVRYNTDRQLKKNDYKEAVDQIEAALNGNDPAPIITDEKIMKNDLEFSADNITDNDSTTDESRLLIAEDVPKPTPTSQKKKSIVAITKPDDEPVKFALLEPEAKENDEKVSRSGRKIKEKKMNLDEMDPDEMFQQPRKRFKTDESKQKPAIVQQADSTSAIDEFRASKMHILQNPVKKSLLENQYDMINKMQEIRLALGLENADVDRSIELLESFKEKNLPHITDLMLLKYPNTVNTVKRLRKYIGNFHSWDMEVTQVEQFQENTQKIRSTASEVYDRFKVNWMHLITRIHLIIILNSLSVFVRLYRWKFLVQVCWTAESFQWEVQCRERNRLVRSP